MAGKNSVDSAADNEDFVVTRAFDAPRALVWKAHTEIERLAKWWGPKGFAWIAGTLDLRPGGAFHYGIRSPQGQEMWGKFVYREIVAPEWLVFVSSFSDPAGKIVRAPFAEDWPLEVLNTLAFSEHAGKTTLAMRARPLDPTDAERKRFSQMRPSMQQGYAGTFAQLDAYLAGG